MVVAKNFEDNTLVVDFDSAEATQLYKSRAFVREINWINKPVLEPRELDVRVRYRDGIVKAIFKPLPDNRAEVEFATPQRAIAPGQVLGIYDAETMLGGAFYE